MDQTGFISFLLIAAFAIFITARGEFPVYVSFFTTTGSDPVAPSSGTSSSSSGGDVGLASSIASLASFL